MARFLGLLKAKPRELLLAKKSLGVFQNSGKLVDRRETVSYPVSAAVERSAQVFLRHCEHSHRF
jgi:hypothetical protein